MLYFITYCYFQDNRISNIEVLYWNEFYYHHENSSLFYEKYNFPKFKCTLKMIEEKQKLLQMENFILWFYWKPQLNHNEKPILYLTTIQLLNQHEQNNLCIW